MLALRNRGGVGQDEGPYQTRVAQSHLHRDLTAHGHTTDDHLFDAQTGEEGGQVIGEIGEQRLARQHWAFPVSPQVRRDHTVTGGRQRGRLGGPHRAVEGMSVDQDYGRSVPGTQVVENQWHAIAKLGVHERTLRGYIEPLAFT